MSEPDAFDVFLRDIQSRLGDDIDSYRAAVGDALADKAPDDAVQLMHGLLDVLDREVSRGHAAAVSAWYDSVWPMTQHYVNVAGEDPRFLELHARALGAMGVCTLNLQSWEVACSYLEPSMSGYERLIRSGAIQHRPAVARLRLGEGHALLALGRIEAAIAAFRAGVAGFTASLAAGERMIVAACAQAHALLGQALERHNDEAGALEAYRQALTDYERSSVGSDSQHRVGLGRTHHRIASILFARRDLDGATREYDAALAIGEALLAEPHPAGRMLIAYSRSGLGSVAQVGDDWVDAEHQFRQALHWLGLEREDDPDVPAALKIYNDLATIATSQQRVADATELYQELVTFLESQVAKGNTELHAEIAQAYAHLAEVSADAHATVGYGRSALTHYALAGAEVVAHLRMQMGIVLDRLATALEETNEWEEALARRTMQLELLQRDAIANDARWCKRLADAHTKTGVIYRTRNEYSSAVPHLQAAISHLTHCDTAQARDLHAYANAQLAGVLALAGDGRAIEQHWTALAQYQALAANGASADPEITSALRMKLGELLLMNQEFSVAAAQLRTALTEYFGLSASEQVRYRSQIPGVYLNLSLTLLRSGDAAAARAALDEYDAHYPQPSTEKSAANLETEVALRSELGRALRIQGDYREAARQASLALTGLDTLVGSGAAHAQGPMLEERHDLGLLLADLGQRAEGLRLIRSVLTEHERLAVSGAGAAATSVARWQWNLGRVLTIEGDLIAAMVCYRAAIAQYEALIHAGVQAVRADCALAHMTLGNALIVERRSQEGLDELAYAITMLEQLVAEGRVKHESDLARANLNLGHSLLIQTQPNQALPRLKIAERIYARVTASSDVQDRGDAALTYSHLGKALADLGDWVGAEQQYRKALIAFEPLLSHPQKTFAEQAAVDHLRLSEVLMQRGAKRDALEQVHAAHRIWSSLWQDGHAHVLQQLLVVARQALMIQLELDGAHAAAVLEAWRVLEQVASDVADAADRGALGDEYAMGACLQLVDLCEFVLPAGVPDASLAPVSRPRAEHFFSAWRIVAKHMLGGGRPDFLRGKSVLIRLITYAALEWRWATMNAPSEVTAGSGALAWILDTQGLRAQRELLPESTDPEVQRLRTLYNHLDIVDRELLGQRDATTGVYLLEPSQHTARDQLAAANHQVRRDTLVAERNERRARLESQGRIAGTVTLTTEQLIPYLPEGEELWFILPMPSPKPGSTGHLFVLRVRGPAAGESTLRESGWMMPDVYQERAQHWRAELDALDRLLGAARGGGVRDALRADTPALESVADTTPLTSSSLSKTLYADTVQVAMLMMECQRTDPRLQSIHLIPLSDAHLLPWANGILDEFGRQRISLGVRQYPSVMAWLRARDFTTAAKGSTPVQPVILHDDARQVRVHGRTAYLPMVSMEVEWSVALWQGTLTAHDRAPACLPPRGAWSPWPPRLSGGIEVDAMIGIGHGGAPEGNWARSGLWMPTWCEVPHSKAIDTERFFSAAQLPELPNVERLFMSCCVLGRVDDRIGEPLGLLTLAFGFQTRVAIGSLLPVADAAAMMISLAFQWRVARAGRACDWVSEFQALRSALKQGRWPEGFSEWACERIQTVDVGDARAALVAEMIREVPSSVRFAIDWFVALG